jgi:glutamine amidotransferase-like uncharacterized protein
MKYLKTFETFISNSTVGNGTEIDYQEGPNLKLLMGISSKKVKIGLYYDYGVKEETVNIWDNFFTKYFSEDPQLLDTKTIGYERIKNLDLLVIPGGKAYRENLGLGEENKADIKRWVSEGGKLLAVCAGAHLVSSGHSWSMNMVPITHIERQEDLSQDIMQLYFSITQKGSEVFKTNIKSARLYFHGGPIFNANKDNDSEIEVLMNFDGEVPHAEGGIKDFTDGKIAAVISKYGKGEILTISPHIEKTTNMDELLSNGIKYLIEKRNLTVF